MLRTSYRRIKYPKCKNDRFMNLGEAVISTNISGNTEVWCPNKLFVLPYQIYEF